MTLQPNLSCKPFDEKDLRLASDLHLGFEEKDPVRGEDSFNTLEEILQIAEKRKVDFILLGGDLFHINKPSKNTLHTTLDLLEKYCLGDRECKVKVVSDETTNFGKRRASGKKIRVNYKNPNMKVSIPVFSIHGNHDDNTGIKNHELSAIDILSVAGLLNHFGKQTNAKEFTISPVSLQKGTTKLALYGLGAIRDFRLYKLFEDKKITFKKEPNHQDWFNIFVLHQNRKSRSRFDDKNFIREEFIDDFFDLVIWGHEHKCIITPQTSENGEFEIMQPGSTVITQMRKSETLPKQVAILRLTGKQKKIEKIPLQTVRRLYFEKFSLSEVVEKQLSEAETKLQSQRYCQERVNALLELAEQDRLGKEKQPKKPLIRLKVDYSNGFDIFNRYQFGADFADRVANPESILLFHTNDRSSNAANASLDLDVDSLNVKLEDLIQKYLRVNNKQIRLLDVHHMSEAVDNFVNKQESKSLSTTIDNYMDGVKHHMKLKKDIDTDDRNAIVEEICRFAKKNTETANESVIKSRGTIDTQAFARPTTSRFRDDISQPLQTLPETFSDTGSKKKKKSKRKKSLPVDDISQLLQTLPETFSDTGSKKKKSKRKKFLPVDDISQPPQTPQARPSSCAGSKKKKKIKQLKSRKNFESLLEYNETNDGTNDWVSDDDVDDNIQSFPNSALSQQVIDTIDLTGDDDDYQEPSKKKVRH